MSVELDFSILEKADGAKPTDRKMFYKLEVERLTDEITKGIQSREDLISLLLRAIECISLMTGDSSFYELNKNNLKNIYGIDTEVAPVMEAMDEEELAIFLE